MAKKLSIFLGCIVVVAMTIFIWFSFHNREDAILAGKQPVRLQLQWFDQAQFIGFYVAAEKSFYAEEGLKVEITPGAYAINPIQRVESGAADIGIGTGDQVLLARAEGHDIKAIGTVFNKSIACFISKKALHIKNAQDLIGRKVGVYRGFDTENILYSILYKRDIRPSNLKIVDAAGIQAFLSDEIQVFPSYVINEPLRMEQEGIPVDILKPDEFGVEFYSDTLFTTTEYWTTNREVIKRFISASAKGWEYAERHRDEALDLMFRYTHMSLNNENNSEHQKMMLDKTVQYIRGGNKNLMFYMDRSRWEKMEALLEAIGKLKNHGYVGDLCDFEIAIEAQE